MYWSRSQTKTFLLQDGFIPTVINCQGAPKLSSFLDRVAGVCCIPAESRWRARVSESGRGGAAEFADFLLLQAVNRYEPLIGAPCDRRRTCIQRISIAFSSQWLVSLRR